jgi:cytochrome c oxidase subunit 2
MIGLFGSDYSAPARWVRPVAALIPVLTLVLTASAAGAAEGLAEPGQLNLLPGVTQNSQDIYWFHNVLLYIITAITIFVLALLLYVILRFNARANPTPSHITHNSTLEVLWTVIPILILVGIAVPSFRILYKQYEFPKPDLTIKAIGNQWFWSYEYPDAGSEVSFDSLMLNDDERALREAAGMRAPRLLAVDNEVVVPVNKVVHVLVTSRDVIHNWTVQAFGSKIDAVPGRLTATWFKAEREGVYYGQCSELCGKDHAFMPIAVRVVSQAVYDQWLAIRKAGGSDADERARELIRNAALASEQQAKIAALTGAAQ